MGWNDMMLEILEENPEYRKTIRKVEKRIKRREFREQKILQQERYQREILDGFRSQLNTIKKQWESNQK